MGETAEGFRRPPVVVVVESVWLAVALVSDWELAEPDGRETSNRLKSTDALGKSVPPTAVAFVTAVEIVDLPTRGRGPNKDGVL